MRAMALAWVAALLTGIPLSAQAPCPETPGFDRLDFWLGEWDVMVEGRPVGTNRITKILDGCAVSEEWTGQGGSRGRSLFYYLPLSGEWKQVWVTTAATRTGGIKEKSLVETLDDGSLRFQGTVQAADGVVWQDRTTLTPLEGGRVRQLIEVSRGGTEWQTTFDGVYVPRTSGDPPDRLSSERPAGQVDTTRSPSWSRPVARLS